MLMIITNQYKPEVLLKTIINIMKAEEIKTKKTISKAISVQDYSIFM